MANNEDYLNNLIAKAKKSWEGVDVDSYISDLRDDTNKEDAEKEQKAIDIDKACEWLKENIEGGVHPQSAYGFVDRFRKAMEE